MTYIKKTTTQNIINFSPTGTDDKSFKCAVWGGLDTSWSDWVLFCIYNRQARDAVMAVSLLNDTIVGKRDG